MRNRLIQAQQDWNSEFVILAGTDVMIFKIFSPQNRRKNWRF
jgi:hypothetical protein